MIPKTIHYCWFGGNPKPKLAEKCIKSWEKYCPDYEIVEWNEDNFDIASAPLYVRQAYEAKKWAFVTDYVRLWAMYSHGGIYMDTDVEIIKPIDEFLKYEAVSGFETGNQIPTGLMACRKGFPLFGELMHDYDKLSFVKEDGSFDMTSNVARITEHCKMYGFIANGEKQTVAGFTLFPSDYFCPKSWVTRQINITENTYAIHHFDASWVTPETYKKIKELDKKEQRKHLPSRIGTKLLGEENYNKLRDMIKK